MPINIQGLMQAIQSGQNPEGMLRHMMQQNPVLQNAMQLLSGKSQQQQMTMLENMAKERGTTIQAVAQRMGLKL